MLTNDDKQWIREEIKSEVEPLKKDIETLKSDVKTLKSDVKTLKSDVKTLKSDVEALKSEVSTLKSDVEALKSEVSTLKSDVEEIKDGIKRINLTIENYLIPLLTEVASAYSGSDLEFQKRAENLGKMQEDMIVNQKMIQDHEHRIKILEARQNMKEATEPFV